MLYLAVVLDRFNPGIVGGPIKPCMRADLVIHALTMAWLRRKPAPGALHHSDRASQGIRQPRIPAKTCARQRALLDEPQGQLLGQRADE